MVFFSQWISGEVISSISASDVNTFKGANSASGLSAGGSSQSVNNVYTLDVDGLGSNTVNTTYAIGRYFRYLSIFTDYS